MNGVNLQAKAELELRRRRHIFNPWERFPARHVLGLDDVTPVPLHVGQIPVWESERRWTVMSAGTQSGKTSFGPWWLYKEIYGGTEGGGRGGGDYYAVTASYDLFKQKMLPAMLRCFVDITGMGRFWGGDRIIELKDPETGEFHAKRSFDPMWGRIVLRSADAPGGLESGTVKAAWLDEAGQTRFTVGAWRAVRRRLSLHKGRVLITTTLYDLGWVKELFIDPCQQDDEPLPGVTVKRWNTPTGVCDCFDNVKDNIRLVQFDSSINPHFDVDEYEDAKATMPEDEFDLFYRGRATSLRHQIYGCFNETTHCVGAFSITPRGFRDVPPEWPIAVGVDPIGEITAALYFAWDPKGLILHVFDEYYEPFGLTTEVHVKNILTRVPPQHYVVGLWGGGPSERQARLDWFSHGLPIEAPPLTDVWVGIRRVYALLKNNKVVIHRCCENLIRELKTYRKKVTKDGTVTQKIYRQNDYHALDCARYAVIGLTTPVEQSNTEIVYNPILIE